MSSGRPGSTIITTLLGSRTIRLRSLSRYWPRASYTVRPSGKRGVISRSRKFRNCVSLTPRRSPILRPSRSSATCWGLSGALQATGCAPALAPSIGKTKTAASKWRIGRGMKPPLVTDTSRPSYGNKRPLALAYWRRLPEVLMLATRLVAPRLAAFVLVSLASTAAQADDVADFYKGKELRLIVSASIGGGYDIYARAVARHLGAHIPGNPTIVPQNMPAAGGLGAANHLNNVAAKDGTVIALFQNTVPLEPFFENKQAQFDAAQVGWLGTPSTETAMYLFWQSSKIRTLDDAQHQEFVSGAAGAASTPA